MPGMTALTARRARGQRAAPRDVMRRILAVAARQAYATIRTPSRYLDVAVWPVVDTVLYGSIAIFMRQGATSGGATRFAFAILSGFIMWHVIFQAQIAVSTGFFEEVYSRQLASLLATPLRPIEWVLGTALQGLAKVAIGVVAVAVTVAVLYQFNLADVGASIVPVMALLLLTGWAMALIVIGLTLFLGSGTEALAWGLLSMVLPLSGALYPVSVLPAPLRPVSAVLPTTYVFSAARTIVLGGAPPWGEIGGAALGTAALMAAGVGFAAFALRTFQRRGFISRYL